MLRITLALFLLAVSAAFVFPQTRKPIFRSIDVSTADKKRSIALGADLASNVDILIKTGDAFVLNGNFGNTERIAVFLNQAGKVRRIVFDYGDRRDFRKLVDSYAKDFGKPKILDSLSSGVLNVKMVAWDDGKTRFEIVDREENGRPRVSSVMIDRKMPQ